MLELTADGHVAVDADQVFLGVVALFELLLDGLVILADRDVFKMNIAGFADFYRIDIQRFRHDFVLPFLLLGEQGHEVLKTLAQLAHIARGGCAVDDSVVEGQRQAHGRVGLDDAALGGLDLRLDVADAENAGLGRVDDGREGLCSRTNRC